MDDRFLGLAPRPVFIGALMGAPHGLLTTYDRLSGRDQMGTHHWMHQTHVWYSALLLGAGAALEFSRQIGTDASTTMMLNGIYGLTARYGNYLHSVVHPPGGGGQAPVHAQGRLVGVPPVAIEAPDAAGFLRASALPVI